MSLFIVKTFVPSQPPPAPIKPPESEKTEPTSVYVNNLPLDITEEEISPSLLDYIFNLLLTEVLCNIDILFSPQGKVKKIKIYLDVSGKAKGDALVTFVRAEAATLACFKVSM